MSSRRPPPGTSAACSRARGRSSSARAISARWPPPWPPGARAPGARDRTAPAAAPQPRATGAPRRRRPTRPRTPPTTPRRCPGRWATPPTPPAARAAADSSRALARSPRLAAISASRSWTWDTSSRDPSSASRRLASAYAAAAPSRSPSSIRTLPTIRSAVDSPHRSPSARNRLTRLGGGRRASCRDSRRFRPAPAAISQAAATSHSSRLARAWSMYARRRPSSLTNIAYAGRSSPATGYPSMSSASSRSVRPG